MTKIKDCLYSPKKRSAVSVILNVGLTVFSLILVFEILFGVLFGGIYVVDVSMTPTLHGADPSRLEEGGGDYIFVDKFAKPDYSDIVVVNNGDRKLIKRVVAFGGDTVKIERGQLYIKYKGETEYTKIDESGYVEASRNTEYYTDRYTGKQVHNKRYDFKPHVVADNSMFLLGDNRNESSDSRDPNNGLNGDFALSDLYGVVPQWSMKIKSFTSGWYNLFQ